MKSNRLVKGEGVCRLGAGDRSGGGGVRKDDIVHLRTE